MAKDDPFAFEIFAVEACHSSDVRDFATVIKDTKGAVAGVFITVNKGDWTQGMQDVADDQGTFKHEQSVDEFPRLQH